jgi:hypothetical protein
MEDMQRHVAVQSPSGTLIPTAEASSRLTGSFAAFAAPALVAAAAVAWAAVRGIDHRFISFSDGVYMYASSVAASDGVHSLYNVVALSLPPGPVLGTALLWKLSPHVETVRLALAVAGALSALLTYLVARRLFTLGRWAAALAAVLALTGPVHAQFVGVDGEVLLTPLVLALALALEDRRRVLSAALLGAGFFCKLTWAPFFLAGIVAIALRDGRRAAVKAGLGGLAFGAALYAVAMAAFGWSAHDLAAQLILAESRSGFQLDLLLGLVAVVVAVWWPFLLLGRAGLARTNDVARLLLAAGGIGALSMLKQGTFFNVLDPLEPLLAIVAVAGAIALWHRGTGRTRALVAVCVLGASLHVASVSRGGLSDALPIPVGAALVNVDNEREVDRVASVVAANSSPDQPVLVNPLFALVAGRHEPAHAADWFILEALHRYCGQRSGRTRHCDDWSRVKALARDGHIPVVSVDSNVVSFDADFRGDTGVASMRRLLRVQKPPIKTTVYSR